MSGSEEIKNRIKETLAGSPMPDFEAERKVEPSPLMAESKLSSPNNRKLKPCAKCHHNHVCRSWVNGIHHIQCPYWPTASAVR